MIALAVGPDLVIGNQAASSRCRGAGYGACRSRAAPSPPGSSSSASWCSRSRWHCGWRRRAKSRLLRAARWGLGLLAVAAVLADSPTSYQAVNPVPPGYQPPATMQPANQLPPFITDGLYRQYLRPGEIVVIITHRGNAGMLFQADGGLLLPDRGRLHQRVADAAERPSAPRHAGRSPSGAADRLFEGYLRSAGVGAIIVEQAWADPWMRQLRQGWACTARRSGGVTIYPVGSLARSARLDLQRARQAARSHAAAHLAHHASASTALLSGSTEADLLGRSSGSLAFVRLAGRHAGRAARGPECAHTRMRLHLQRHVTRWRRSGWAARS